MNGKSLATRDDIISDIANFRIDIESSRNVVLQTAFLLDTVSPIFSKKS